MGPAGGDLGALTLCVLGLAAWLLQRSIGNQVGPPASRQPSAETHVATADSAVPANVATEPQGSADDPGALWQSPTNGDPITLQLVPPGVRCLVHFNVQRWRDSAEAQRTWRALGPAFARYVDHWQRSHEVVLRDQQRVLWAFIPAADGTLGMFVRGEPRDSWSVPASWKPIAGEPRGRFRSGHLEAMTQTVDDQRYWLLGPPELVEPLATRTQPAAPLLQRQLETLRRETDRERQFTIMATASFLWNHGGEFGLRPLVEAIELHCGDGLQALAFSGHAQDHVETFLELHTVWRTGAVSRDPAVLLDHHQRAIAMASQALDTRRPFAPYWRSLGERVPRMLTLVQQQVRVQSSSRLVMANVSLPPAAAHNLALAAELMLNLTPARDSAAALTSKAPSGAAKADPITLLVTYQFDQQSLVDALAGLEAEVQRLLRDQRFSIELDGQALRAEGITRNQQIKDFRQLAAPLTQQLTELVRQANPGRADSLTSPEQKLVWAVLQREPEGDATVILITTRKAAMARSLDLPGVFVNP